MDDTKKRVINRFYIDFIIILLRLAFFLAEIRI